jgi:DMSO/TMAO reductase YedYZ molybdopterin-dependent catalytic subunit
MQVYWRLICVLWLCLLAGFSPIARAADALLTIDGDVTKPVVLSEADFKALPHTSVSIAADTYSGVALSGLLKMAGVPLQDDLKGKDVAKYLHAQGADGFVAVFALPEFDTGVFVVADSLNGAPLPQGTGVLQLISPGEKRHSRWIKQLATLRIKVSQL